MSNAPAHRRPSRQGAKSSPAAPSPAGKKTVYETSAGGVVLRHIRGCWQVALIEPNIINADSMARRTKARPDGTVFALPKGGVDEGETPEQSADREVFEETGVHGNLLFRLTTIRYLYQRSWGGREHVSKAVSFYLFLYKSGRLGQIEPEMRDEVRTAFWFPLDKAHRKLTYRGEREVLRLAQKIVREHPERLTPPGPAQHLSGPEVVRPVAQQRGGSQRAISLVRQGAAAKRSAGGRGSARGAGQNRGGLGKRAMGKRGGEARPGGERASGGDGLGPRAARPS